MKKITAYAVVWGGQIDREWKLGRPYYAIFPKRRHATEYILETGEFQEVVPVTISLPSTKKKSKTR